MTIFMLLKAIYLVLLLIVDVSQARKIFFVNAIT